jgi:hypothetical protein
VLLAIGQATVLLAIGQAVVLEELRLLARGQLAVRVDPRRAGDGVLAGGELDLLLAARAGQGQGYEVFLRPQVRRQLARGAARPSSDVCSRAWSRLVKLGIMRSMPVIAKTRRTAMAGMTSSSSPPSL